jgi:AraC-like DNA-binding protein
MIPISYLISLTALASVIYIITQYRSSEGQFWLILFLLTVASINVIIGTRFGYGIEFLGRIQPLVAILIPPLSYLAFKRPKTFERAWLHGIPILIFSCIYFYNQNYIDMIIGISGIIYSCMLIYLGINGIQKLTWVKFGDNNRILFLLIAVIITLSFSSITDGIIFLDFFFHDGENLKNIVVTASILGVVLGISSLFFFHFYKQNQTPNIDGDEAHALQGTYDKIEQLMREKKFFLNPDLNLIRLAKRLSLPSREVSRAVNIHTNQSLSNYVNNLRIEEAQKMLKNSNTPITQIIYACGFNTKSNFNREFQRVTGKTPSDWRKANQMGKS